MCVFTSVLVGKCDDAHKPNTMGRFLSVAFLYNAAADDIDDDKISSRIDATYVHTDNIKYTHKSLCLPGCRTHKWEQTTLWFFVRYSNLSNIQWSIYDTLRIVHIFAIISASALSCHDRDTQNEVFKFVDEFDQTRHDSRVDRANEIVLALGIFADVGVTCRTCSCRAC